MPGWGRVSGALGHVSRVNQWAHTAPPDLLRKLEQGLPTMRKILDSKADPAALDPAARCDLRLLLLPFYTIINNESAAT